VRLVADRCTLVLVAGAWASAGVAQAAASSAAAGVQQSATSAVVADTFWSQSLGIRKRVMIWLPPSYAAQPQKRYPVAYYLHGAQGDETNWLNLGRLGSTLDSLASAGVPEMIVVMPDGDDGFYTTWNFLGDWPGCRRSRPPNAEPADSYCVPWPHYDDYIARDLVAFIDREYRTLPDRRHRALAGLSMGGYGAMALALSYPEVFSAAASISGVIAPSLGGGRSSVPRGRFDLDSLRASYALWLWPLVQPAFGKDSVAWAARDPASIASRLLKRRPDMMPALFVDCGSEDPFLIQSQAFRDALRASGGQLVYEEHAGGHSWDYWRHRAGHTTAWLAARLAVP
jgi:enterochelin esterase family protein